MDIKHFLSKPINIGVTALLAIGARLGGDNGSPWIVLSRRERSASARFGVRIR